MNLGATLREMIKVRFWKGIAQKMALVPSQEERAKYLKEIDLAWIIIIALNLLDIVSTYMFMSLGHSEGNPLMAFLFSEVSFLFGITIKMLVLFAGFTWYATMIRKNEKLTRGFFEFHYACMYLVFVIYFLIVLINFIVVIKIA